MANNKNRHVVRNPNGGWDMKVPRASRAGTLLDAQAAAAAPELPPKVRCGVVGNT